MSDEELPHVVEHINSLIGSAFRSANDKRARSQQRALGMSELGTCRRQAGFKVTGTPMSNPPHERTDVFADSREAMIGTLIHDTVLPQIAAMSMTAEIEQRVVLEFDGLPAIPGSADLVDGTVLGDLKCVSPDTMILRSDGRLARAENIQPGDRVVAWDIIYKRLTHAEVASVSENGDQPTVEIVTESGRAIRVTEDHPVWLRDDVDSSPRWAKASTVEPNEYLHVALGAPIESPNIQPGLGPDDAWLLGLLAAEPFTPDTIMSIVDEGTRSVALTSLALATEEQVAALWEDNPWIGTTPIIPDAVILSGARAWAEWLSGYSAGGLHIDPRAAWWSTPNREFADQMAAMLAGLGIKADVSGEGKSVRVEDDYAIGRLRSALWLRGSLSSRIAALAGSETSRPDYYELDQVVSVVTRSEPVRTLAIEVAEHHTFVTGGLITHNTVGHNSAAKYQTSGASKRHLWQTHGYAQALINSGHPIENVALFYLDRSNGQIIHTHYQPFDPAIVAEIEMWWTEVNAVDDPMKLPRDGRGPDDRMCQWCPWLEACWGEGATAESAARSIVADAADPGAEIAKHLAIYNEASVLEKQAKIDKAQARDVLAQVEPGNYGEFSLGWKAEAVYNVLDTDAAVKMLEDAGLPVPKVERRNRPAIDVKRTSNIRTTPARKAPVRKPKP